jgi:hypothetical protein
VRWRLGRRSFGGRGGTWAKRVIRSGPDRRTLRDPPLLLLSVAVGMWPGCGALQSVPLWVQMPWDQQY